MPSNLSQYELCANAKREMDIAKRKYDDQYRKTPYHLSHRHPLKLECTQLFFDYMELKFAYEALRWGHYRKRK